MKNKLIIETDDFVSESDTNFETVETEGLNSTKQTISEQTNQFEETKKVVKLKKPKKPKKQGKLEATSLGLIGSSFGYLALAMSSFGITDQEGKLSENI
ncbi:hypothetical protein M0811_08957 [Anaeramoeba ignava]|uniref:Uncharacterized protein n=1 Tax=Anaeramoeba ignava TaxID=1746090 RepID=A0A9Q0LK31_ANAIG|nr:hypothetical protein M0811_08957 [Anaeramoeba ignava]